MSGIITLSYLEHGAAIPDRPYLACYSKDEPALAVVGHERIGLREIVMTFNRPVGGIPVRLRITLPPFRCVR